MQDHLKYLVVDDITEWANQLKEAVADYFIEEKRFARARVRSFTAYDATQADNQIADGGWDLVLLDMNLGDGSKRGGAKSRISGLDLLGDIARGNRAYFVIIVTGAVTDPDLEKVYGPDTAALLRFGAMNEAVRMMPASRVRILHKPDAETVKEAVETIRQQLHSALDQYCSVSMERNVFRALPGDPKLVEICFNGGPRLTLPFEAPFRTIQSALAQPNRMLKVTELIQKLAHSSGKAGAAVEEEQRAAKGNRKEDNEYQGLQDDEVSSADGLDWEEMEGFGISSVIRQCVDLPEGTIPIESIIGGLLRASRRERDLNDAFKGIAEMGVDEKVLLSIPRVAANWASKGNDADAEFEIDNAPDALMALVRKLKPILEPIKNRWLAEKKSATGEGKPSGKRGKATVRVAVDVDTNEMELARQHWFRFKAKIKARPGLKTFHEHVINWIPRDPTARGHLYYRPPGGGEFCPFWLTE